MSVADLRTDWIRRRRADGYDFAPLVDAVSRLVVRPGEDDGSLIVDASALVSDEYQVRAWWLVPHDEGRGLWCHDGSGECGPLPELLFTIALIYLEDGPNDHG